MEQVVSFLFKYRGALYSKSQFGFGAQPPVILIIGAVAGLALLVYLLYVTPSLKLAPKWRAALIATRVALIAVIFFCLMRPVIVIPSVIAQSTYLAVLMDDSASMNYSDRAGTSRLETVKQLMTADRPFYTQALEKFKLKSLKFSEVAERVRDAGELTGAGQRTNLDAALEQAARESSGLPYSGIVLISDGATNAEANSADSLANTLAGLRARGLPVYVIGVGPTSLENDIELVRATAPRRVIAGSPVTAEILIRAGASRSVRVDLTEDNHALRSQDVAVQGGSTTVARVTFTPSSPGIHRYVLAAPAPEDDPIPDNNSQEVLIEVVDARPRILYIEGEPRWEYGKMRESLAEEKNITLVSVLRSADGKYYRQGIENPEELAGGFPKSEEELFKYDAIIIGSIEATFFTFDQLKAVEQFVSRRGGTLMALGGTKAFSAGGYASTPLADLLPVYLRAEAVAGESQSFKAAPGERGRDHPAARLADQPEANQKAWEQMPAITLPEILADTKPGATVVLEARGVKDRSRSVPLLAEERYGRGRTLAFMASDTWRWRMMMESKNKSFETFWRNLLRYTVDSVRRPVEVSTERSFYGAGEAVRIRAEVADEKYVNITDAVVTAQVTTPSGDTFDIQLKPSADAGFEGYAAGFAPNEDGVYRIEVKAQGGPSNRGPQLRTAQTNLIVGPLNREAHEAAQNQELLKRIAAETGGGYYTADQTAALLEDVTHAEGPGTVRETMDLWDMPINFMMIVGLAACEWFIRKRKGLA